MLFFLLIGDVQASLVPGAAAITWMIFSVWCNSSPLILLRRPKIVRDLFLFGPVIIIVSYFSGYNKAIEQALTKPELVEIELDDGKSVTFQSLRTLENGFLFISEEGEVRLLSWDIVRSYSFVENYEPFRGILCEWFGLCANIGEAHDDTKKSVE